MNHARPSMLVRRYAIPLALVLAAGSTGTAHAVLHIGSHTTQNHVTTQQHANAIQLELARIAGTNVNVALAPQADANGRQFWVVTLGAQGNRPQGFNLLTALINSAHTTTIAIDAGLAGQGGGGVTYCANGKTISPLAPAACKVGGAGTDAVVTISSGQMPSNLNDANAPFYILFGHELVHAWHATVGQRHANNGTNEARTIGNYLGINPQVAAAALPPGVTVNENLLRGENTVQNGNPMNCRHPTNGQFTPPVNPPHAHC